MLVVLFGERARIEDETLGKSELSCFLKMQCEYGGASVVLFVCTTGVWLERW